MHPLKSAQISHLKIDEVYTKVLRIELCWFCRLFFSKIGYKTPQTHGNNDYAIELINDWQLTYAPIYSLRPVELETLKVYIKNNLANHFIKPVKFSVGAPILFDKKSDGSLRFCKDYQYLNNLTIKNWYPLFLVRKSFDWLYWACRFTQLELTNAYH